MSNQSGETENIKLASIHDEEMSVSVATEKVYIKEDQSAADKEIKVEEDKVVKVEKVKEVDIGTPTQKNAWGGAKEFKSMESVTESLKDIMTEELKEKPVIPKVKEVVKKKERKKKGSFTTPKIVSDSDDSSTSTVSYSSSNKKKEVKKEVKLNVYSERPQVTFKHEVIEKGSSSESIDGSSSDSDVSVKSEKSSTFESVQEGDNWGQTSEPDKEEKEVSSKVLSVYEKKCIEREEALEEWKERPLGFVIYQKQKVLAKCGLISRDNQLMLLIGYEKHMKEFELESFNSLATLTGFGLKIRRFKNCSNVQIIDVIDTSRNWFQKVAVIKDLSPEEFRKVLLSLPFNLSFKEIDSNKEEKSYRTSTTMFNFVWPDVLLKVEFCDKDKETYNDKVSLTTMVDDWLHGNMAVGVFPIEGKKIVFLPGRMVGECMSNIFLPVFDVKVKKFTKDHVNVVDPMIKGNVILRTISRSQKYGELRVTTTTRLRDLEHILQRRCRLSNNRRVLVYMNGSLVNEADDLCTDHIEKAFSWRIRQ